MNLFVFWCFISGTSWEADRRKKQNTPLCVCVSVCVRAQSLSSIDLFVTPWTIACQAPLFVGFPRQEYWSGLSFPPPGDLPDPGIEHVSPVSTALANGFNIMLPPGKPKVCLVQILGKLYCHFPEESGECLVTSISFQISRKNGIWIYMIVFLVSLPPLWRGKHIPGESLAQKLLHQECF